MIVYIINTIIQFRKCPTYSLNECDDSKISRRQLTAGESRAERFKATTLGLNGGGRGLKANLGRIQAKEVSNPYR